MGSKRKTGWIAAACAISMAWGVNARAQTGTEADVLERLEALTVLPMRSADEAFYSRRIFLLKEWVQGNPAGAQRDAANAAIAAFEAEAARVQAGEIRVMDQWYPAAAAPYVRPDWDALEAWSKAERAIENVRIDLLARDLRVSSGLMPLSIQRSQFFPMVLTNVIAKAKERLEGDTRNPMGSARTRRERLKAELEKAIEKLRQVGAPAAVPVPGLDAKRLSAKELAQARERYLMIGTRFYPKNTLHGSNLPYARFLEKDAAVRPLRESEEAMAERLAEQAIELEAEISSVEDEMRNVRMGENAGRLAMADAILALERFDVARMQKAAERVRDAVALLQRDPSQFATAKEQIEEAKKEWRDGVIVPLSLVRLVWSELERVSELAAQKQFVEARRRWETANKILEVFRRDLSEAPGLKERLEQGLNTVNDAELAGDAAKLTAGVEQAMARDDLADAVTQMQRAWDKVDALSGRVRDAWINEVAKMAFTVAEAARARLAWDHAREAFRIALAADYDRAALESVVFEVVTEARRAMKEGRWDDARAMAELLHGALARLSKAELALQQLSKDALDQANRLLWTGHLLDAPKAHRLAKASWEANPELARFSLKYWCVVIGAGVLCLGVLFKLLDLVTRRKTSTD